MNVKKEYKKPSKKNIISILFVIIAVSLLFLLIGKIIFISLNKYSDIKINRIKQVGKYTTAKIIKRNFSSRSSHCVYEFNVKETKYEDDITCNLDIQESENYLLLYDSINPKNNKLIFERPIFLKNQIIDSTICYVISIDDYDVRVKYTIDKKEYIRFQRIKSLGKIYQVGNSYKFKFLVENPNIGFISPLCEECINLERLCKVCNFAVNKYKSNK